MPNLVLVATEMETVRPTGAVPSLEEGGNTNCPRTVEPNRMNTGTLPVLGDVVRATVDLGLDLATTAMPNLAFVATEMRLLDPLELCQA